MKEILDIDFNLLKCLDTLLEERSVSKAACRLGVKQPAMSAALVRLREAFQDELFTRGHRQMIPTKRALDLKEPVRKIVKDISTIFQPKAFDPFLTEATVAIATTDYTLKTIVPQLLQALKSAAPDLRISLMFEKGHHLVTALEAGKVDLALITDQNPIKHLQCEPLFEDRYVGVLRRDHPILATGKNISIDDFCALEHAIISSPIEEFSCTIDETLRQMGKSRNVRLSANYITSLVDFLKTSDLISVLPSRLLVGLPELEIFELPVEAPTFRTIAAWHPRTEFNPVHIWLRTQVFDQLKNELFKN
ncbi:LysR family transcriptional regulator [Pseudomonas sp. BN605]|uniref:Transcriptional regulator n=1 Tax=Pseudomonas hunanensis TaxID=1247546 RepID=A0ABD6MX55_9PSED|nr:MULTISPECIES: LysR family transcriptional regulator [Pseudomonas]MDH4847999.1 LysR family transcriptional regulator [Pseudomonas sp. BN605]NWL45571.1 transcriptional regulator [Pseudomonas hunanensis]